MVKRFDIKVGDKLFWVSHFRRGTTTEVVISSIGRRWVTLQYPGYRNDHHPLTKFDINDWRRFHPGCQSGLIYRDEAEYREECALRIKFQALRRSVSDSGGPKDGVTIADIEAAAALLKITLTE